MRDQGSDRPSFGIGRVGGCLATGIGAGGILGGAAGIIGYGVFHDEGHQDDIAGVQGFIAGGIIGYTIGNSLGVHWFGQRGEVAGSYRATLIGSVLGLLAGGAGLYVSERVIENDGSNDKVSAAIFLIGPPVGATAAFYLTHRPDIPQEDGTALINVHSGHICLAVPSIHPGRGTLGSPGFEQEVLLVHTRF
jgi:hypothetical protein